MEAPSFCCLADDLGELSCVELRNLSVPLGPLNVLTVCSRKHSTLCIRLLGGGGLLFLWLLTLIISPFTGTCFLHVSKQCCSWMDIIQSGLYCSLRLKTLMVFGTMKIKPCSFFQ